MSATVSQTLRTAARRQASRPRHVYDRGRSGSAALGGDPRGARSRRRRRARGGRAVLRSARRWPGDPARHRAGDCRGRKPARLAGDDRGRSGRRSQAPIVIFSYANPLLRLGLDAFARQAADAGVDGVLALDLPIEEAGELPRNARGGRHRHHLPAQPDDDRGADQDGGGAGQRVPLRDLAARASPARARRWRRAPKRWCAGFARTRRCRSRSGSASRGPSTSPRSARMRTRRWSAARSSR